MLNLAVLVRKKFLLGYLPVYISLGHTM